MKQIKKTILFFLLMSHFSLWASVDSFVKAYLTQEEGCQNISTREDKTIPISMNHFVDKNTNKLYPEAISCDPQKLDQHRFKDFLVNTMEGSLNIDSKKLCENLKSIPTNGEFNLDWESQFKELMALGENSKVSEKLKLKLNIINHSISLIKSCQWQWLPEQRYTAGATSQSCVIEMNDYFHHNKAEFVSSYSPEIISKKVKGCLDRFPNTIIENVSIFISSDGSHAQGVSLKDVNEQLTKDRLAKVKTQLNTIFNSNELKNNTANEISIDATLGWNNYGSSGPEKIITAQDMSIKEELQKYRKTTITVFLKKKTSEVSSVSSKGNLILKCLSTIYSCSQSSESLGKEISSLVLRSDKDNEATASTSKPQEAKGI